MNVISHPLILVAALAASSACAAEAPALWKKHCTKCHGADGRGDTKQGHKLYISDLTNPEIQAKFTDAEATASIKVGLKDAKGRTIMHAIRGLSDDDIAKLVVHVRSLKK